MNYIDCGGGDH